jgi:outer membrane protein
MFYQIRMKSFSTLCVRTLLVSVVSLGIMYHVALQDALAQVAPATTGESTLAAPVRTFTLEECLKIAVGDNPEVQLASVQLQNAAGVTKSAFAGFLPSVSINGGYNRTLNDTTLRVFPRPRPNSSEVELAFTPFYTPDVFRNGFSLNGSIDYVIFNGLQRENGYAQAQASQRSSELTFFHTRRLILATVRSQYLTIMRSKQVLRVRQEDFAIGKKQLERIRAQYEAGVIAIAVVYTQEADLANRELIVVQAENELEAAKGTLLATLGMNPGVPSEFTDITTPQTIGTSDVQAFRTSIGEFTKAFTGALDKRADLASAKASIDAANAGVGVAQAGYLPTVTANASYNWNSPVVGNFQYASQSIGLNFRYLIFDGFDRDAGSQRARALVLQAEIQKRQAEQRIATDVQNAFIQLNASEKNIDITLRALKAAQQNFEAADERFKVGAANILDFTTANANLATSKINRITALYNYIGAQYQMKFALGLLDE